MPGEVDEAETPLERDDPTPERPRARVDSRREPPNRVGSAQGRGDEDERGGGSG